ncbi:MAG TPA: multidrug effflux MFS transporter [Hyphomicrobiales bacterium]|nr:multidrug effflux MFS transporter [Hyphomicrobiales bacterium]
MTLRPDSDTAADPRLGFAEFVGLIAAMIAITAFSIDIMLPAFPAIAAELGIALANDRQEIITAYMIGFAVGQIACGPVSDTFGRRPVAFAGFALFIAATVAAAFAQSFPALLAARAAQGIGAAAPRIMALAIVRDRFAGDRMARVMSLVMTVFIVVPVVAPSIGQLILLVGTWRWIFGFLLVFGLAALAWAWFRLPETLSPANRRPFRPGTVASAVATAVTTRQTVGYGTAMGLIFGALMTYLGTAQQILGELYGLERLFPVAFGFSALAFAAASFTNSRLVMRFGTRRLSHTALVAFIAVTAGHGLLALAGDPPFPVYFALVSLSMFLFGLIGPNFNALAMEPLGRIAGTAASFVGAFSTTVSALAGWLIGRQFDGTVAPIALGFAGLGLACLVTVLVTERGRLSLRP